ncbi:glycosyltransferase family protein [Bacillus sp. FJAT-29790]|uniref:cytidylyltransferase domain-containing protein n=1 Tax=Bacillus sp. FJAT-29790 TaxID=1895002 RepID=UPI001C213C9D|nr:glycosyltransferase family protein [Bacillus sp. FJAT-29790]MBU8881196.1 glycosyltransferase family protein [Bacillus sp. FJAT-29790]
MKTIAIIQARMGSSRLPGKILKPLGNYDVLTYVVERCKKMNGVSEVIVATSTLPQDDMVEVWCKNKGVSYFRGSEADVLDRYAQAATKYTPDYVMRVTADCPFVDYELAAQMVETMKEDPADFMSIDGVLPRGLAVELFSYKSLEYIHKNGKEPRHREHVTYYAYEHRNEFSWTSIKANDAIQKPKFRITLDTAEDYELCKRIAEHFEDHPFVTAEEVVNYLKDHPAIAQINAHIEQKPVV